MGGVHCVGKTCSGDQPRAVLHHLIDRVVVDEESVLDAVDTRCNCVAHRLGAVRVRRDLQAAPVCLVDYRAQLLIGIVLGACRSGHRHHAAGDTHLDELGAVLDLVSDGLANLVDTVGDAFFDGQIENTGCEGREHRRIQVTAGRGDRVTGRNDARSVHPSGVDRLTECDVEEITAGLHEQSQISDGREAGTQRAAGIAHRTQHAQRRIVLHRGVDGFSPRPPMSRLTSMSIRPGMRI